MRAIRGSPGVSCSHHMPLPGAAQDARGPHSHPGSVSGLPENPR